MNEAKNVTPQSAARKKFDSATVDKLIDEILLEKRNTRAVFTSVLPPPLGSVSTNEISENEVQERLYVRDENASQPFTELLKTYAITTGAGKVNKVVQ